MSDEHRIGVDDILDPDRKPGDLMAAIDGWIMRSIEEVHKPEPRREEPETLFQQMLAAVEGLPSGATKPDDTIGVGTQVTYERPEDGVRDAVGVITAMRTRGKEVTVDLKIFQKDGHVYDRKNVRYHALGSVKGGSWRWPDG